MPVKKKYQHNDDEDEENERKRKIVGNKTKGNKLL